MYKVSYIVSLKKHGVDDWEDFRYNTWEMAVCVALEALKAGVIVKITEV